MMTKWLEKKLQIVERDIEKWESKENTATVKLRQAKEKQWALIEQLEKREVKQ
jgi:hypothetical protein